MDFRGVLGLNNQWEPILENYMNAYFHVQELRLGTKPSKLEDDVFCAWIINKFLFIWEWCYRLFYARKSKKKLTHYKKNKYIEDNRMRTFKFLCNNDDWLGSDPEEEY